MTIVNVVLLGDRALVGTNDDARLIDSGASTQISKLFPLTHLRAIVLGRGTALFTWFAYWGCHECGSTFDAVADGLLAYLKARMATYAASPEYAAMEPSSERFLLHHYQEACLVGWSERRRAMAGFAFAKRGPECELEREEMTKGHWFAPWHGSLEEGFRMPRHAAGLYGVARRQAAMMRTLEPETGANGGDFVVAELGRDSLNIATAGNLDPASAGAL